MKEITKRVFTYSFSPQHLLKDDFALREDNFLKTIMINLLNVYFRFVSTQLLRWVQKVFFFLLFDTDKIINLVVLVG